MANEHVITPHWELPFRFTKDGDALAVEQDSDSDIQNCVYAILAYQPGQLLCDPTFGMSDPSLKKVVMDLSSLSKLIIKWDDRAKEIIDRDPNWMRRLVDTISVRRNF